MTKWRRKIAPLAGALMLAVTAAGLAALAPRPALAVEANEMLDDPVLEQRARDISKRLRCLVCQNQSIDDSDADLARDLRKIVRERLVAGDTDQEVMAFMVERYGDWVLMKPPVKPKTYVLWFGPAAILLIGGLGVALYLRSQRRSPAQGDGGDGAGAAPLSDEERARLERLLDDGEERS